jgi:hypothetical protein
MPLTITHPVTVCSGDKVLEISTVIEFDYLKGYPPSFSPIDGGDPGSAPEVSVTKISFQDNSLGEMPAWLANLISSSEDVHRDCLAEGAQYPNGYMDPDHAMEIKRENDAFYNSITRHEDDY